MSVPNQKIVTIHQSKETPFIRVGKEEWKDMYCKLQDNPCAVALFMYLAGNQEGYQLELSPAAFENASGMSRSSFYRGRDILLDKGYLYRDGADRLNFRTNLNTEIESHFGEPSSTPKKRKRFKAEMAPSQESNEKVSQMNREIDNRKVIDKKDKASSKDFSYLDKVVLSDGCFDDTSFDVLMPLFWGYRDDRKIEEIAKNTRFSREEAEYIVHKVLESCENEIDRKHPLGYLYEEVSAWGFFDGKWLDEEITAFWEQSTCWKKKLIEEKTRFSKDEADFIVDHILIKDSPSFIPDQELRIMSTQPSYRNERQCSDGRKVVYTEKGVEYGM